MIIPVIINFLISAGLFLAYGYVPESMGYAMGTVLALILSAFWLVQSKRISREDTGAVSAIRTVAVGFGLKLVLLIIFLVVCVKNVPVNVWYFAGAFGTGIVFSLIAEMILYFSVSAKIRMNRFRS